MDWSAIGSWLAFASSVIVGAFVYGRLTQLVTDLKARVDDHETRIRVLEKNR